MNHTIGNSEEVVQHKERSRRKAPWNIHCNDKCKCPDDEEEEGVAHKRRSQRKTPKIDYNTKYFLCLDDDDNDEEASSSGSSNDSVFDDFEFAGGNTDPDPEPTMWNDVVEAIETVENSNDFDFPEDAVWADRDDTTPSLAPSDVPTGFRATPPTAGSLPAGNKIRRNPAFQSRFPSSFPRAKKSTAPGPFQSRFPSSVPRAKTKLGIVCSSDEGLIKSIRRNTTTEQLSPPRRDWQEEAPPTKDRLAPPPKLLPDPTPLPPQRQQQQPQPQPQPQRIDPQQQCQQQQQQQQRQQPNYFPSPTPIFPQPNHPGLDHPFLPNPLFPRQPAPQPAPNPFSNNWEQPPVWIQQQPPNSLLHPPPNRTLRILPEGPRVPDEPDGFPEAAPALKDFPEPDPLVCDGDDSGLPDVPASQAAPAAAAAEPRARHHQQPQAMSREPTMESVEPPHEQVPSPAPPQQLQQQTQKLSSHEQWTSAPAQEPLESNQVSSKKPPPSKEQQQQQPKKTPSRRPLESSEKERGKKAKQAKLGHPTESPTKKSPKPKKQPRKKRGSKAPAARTTTGPWEKQERLEFLRGLRIHGRGKWKKIGEAIPTRSVRQVCNHAKNVLRQLEQGVNIFEELDDKGKLLADDKKVELELPAKRKPGGQKSLMTLAVEAVLENDPGWKRLAQKKQSPEAIEFREQVHTQLLKSPTVSKKELEEIGKPHSDEFIRKAHRALRCVKDAEKICQWSNQCEEKQKARRREVCKKFQQHDLIGTKIGDTVITEENVSNQDIANVLLNQPRERLRNQSIMDVAKKGQGVCIGASHAARQRRVEAECVRFLTDRKRNVSAVQKDLSWKNDGCPENNTPRFVPHNNPHNLPLECLTSQECKQLGMFTIELMTREWRSKEDALKLEQMLQVSLDHLPFGTGKLHRKAGCGVPHSSLRNIPGIMTVFATILPPDFFKSNPAMVVVDELKNASKKRRNPST